MNGPWWGYVESLTRWAAGVAVVATLVGGIVTADVRFVLTCAAVALADLWLFSRAGSRGRELVESGSGVSAGAVALLIGIRLTLKAVALVAAAMLPSVLSFWGAVTGSLVVDTTVLVIGGATAAIRVFGSPGSLGGGR